MLRRVLLVVLATVVSYVLTACSGYILYTISEGRSEAHLSLMVRFLFNPNARYRKGFRTFLVILVLRLLPD